MNSFTVLIVDDEPLAREGIKDLLDKDPEVKIAGMCKNGFEAIKAVKKHKPDIIFLDIQMPEMNGFQVLREIGTETNSVVIFVTAFDKYAIEAFDVQAVDYLLKPVDEERFHKAVARAKSHFQSKNFKELHSKLQKVIDTISGNVVDGTSLEAKGFLDRLIIKSTGNIAFIKVDEIDWIEAADYYVQIHTGKDAHLLRESMSALEQKLDPKNFVRIHRSTIVNIDRIKELKTMPNGDYKLLLDDGKMLRVSRSRNEEMRKLFQ